LYRFVLIFYPFCFTSVKLSRVLHLAASMYPIRVSKKTRFGSCSLIFAIFFTIFEFALFRASFRCGFSYRAFISSLCDVFALFVAYLSVALSLLVRTTSWSSCEPKSPQTRGIMILPRRVRREHFLGERKCKILS